MIDIEKFLISLRGNKDLDGRADPIRLADTVKEEIQIVQAAVEYSRRQWQGLTETEQVQVAIDCGCFDVAWLAFARAIEAKLKEKNT